MFWLLLTAPLTAFGGGPTVDIHPDGAVVGRIRVPGGAEAIRTLVDDPLLCSRLSPEVVSVQADPSTNDCHDMVTETKGLFRPLRVRSRRCRTADGWEEALVQSDDFQRYESRWSVRELDGETEVTLQIHTEVGLPVPTSVVQKRQKKSVGEILENLVQKILR